MTHTKLPSSQPAGTQLACTKKSARVGLRPNAGLFQHGSYSSPAFHFICTSTFMSGAQSDVFLFVCVSVCKGDRLTRVHFGPIYRLLGTLAGPLWAQI